MIYPLNLDEFAALRSANNIKSDLVEPMVDATYVMLTIELLAIKINEMIEEINNQHPDAKL